MMMAKPILVLLAAGMGSRYGGLKQIDKIGPCGEALLDYSVYDALSAGFGKVVFVIRHDFENDFRDTVLKRMERAVKCELAFQDLDTLIPRDIMLAAKRGGRVKPWGSGHALLCAKNNIDAPFAVINADDFYSRSAFTVMGKYLSQENVVNGAIVPYELQKTLSPVGTVTRGICTVENGMLKSVDELQYLKREADGNIYNVIPNDEKKLLAPDVPVSMNFWGFPPDIMDEFQKYFDDFLASEGGKLKSECYLPLAVDTFIKSDKLQVEVLNTEADWFGVTYKDDKALAQKHLDALTKAGVYPASLWTR
jgi:choline kinase